MKRISFILLAVGVLISSCTDNTFSRIELPEYEYVAANTDIGDLKAAYNGEPLNVYNDLIIAGYVTANDKGDNFYRSFIIDDPTGAIEVKAGMFDLHNIFVCGRRVAIKAKGLTIGSYNGVLQIGRASVEGGAKIEYIANRYYQGSFFYPQTDYAAVAPQNINLDQLQEEYCGRLIRICGLQFDDEGFEGEFVTWADKKQTSYRAFEDTQGNRITVMTSGYADFAGYQIPKGSVDITGILMKGNTDRARNVFIIKFRGIEDVVEK